MQTVTVPFPEVEVNCPSCDASFIVHGDEFLPKPYHRTAFGRAEPVCESCDTVFEVLVGE